MSQTIQSPAQALIEDVVRTFPQKAQDRARQLFNDVFLRNLTALSPGGNLILPGGAQANASAPPTGVTHSASGANAVITVSIANPPTPQGTAIYHEFSYSPIVSFTKGVVTAPATTETTLTIPAPGGLYYGRLRSSYDRKTWTPYQLSSTSPINAGFVESGTMSPASAFNQTNFAVVNSQAAGSAAVVTISGAGGDLTSYPAIRGTAQAIRPSGTIIGVVPGSEQFVGWDGTQFRLKPTLAGVLADNLEPVGKVSVVSTATPTLPTIDPVVQGGYILGFNVVNGGAGASQPYGLTFGNVGGGAGATFGAQTIVAGVLISVAAGNPGNGAYSGGTTVTASGGSGGGASGGGTALGGNGGRLTDV